MANSTRMRISTNASVFHRIAETGDMPEHDIGTTDTVAQGMGSTIDFEIESDETVVHVDASAVFDAGGIGTAVGDSTSIGQYIYIKHTGFTTSDKDTATTSDLRVGLTSAGFTSAGGFTLVPGESITLHGLASPIRSLEDYVLLSISGDIYVEIKYL